MKNIQHPPLTAAAKNSNDEATALLLLNALPDAVIAFDATLAIHFANQAAQEFFVLGRKQLLEKNLKDLLGMNNALLEHLEAVVRQKKGVTLHDIALHGRSVHSVTILALEQHTAPEQGDLFLMTIKQQPFQLADEWNEKTKYSLKSSRMIAQMLAHEVKNPLAGIHGAAQLLASSKLNEDDTELAHLIAREAVRIQKLVDKFNIFYDVPPDHYKTINLHQVLTYVAKMATMTYGDDVEFVESYDPSLPEMRGNFDYLVQAKLNLIKNAAEAFKNKKGKISIRTFYDTAAAVHPDRLEKLPLCIEIEDNGQGMDSETIRRIFEPYFTTKPQGQGLGLPIVSKIVDDHGGVIGVTSKPGKTVFRLSFPVPKDMIRK
jgi:two-component system nitrogen regulation sensor histidine kinase GlnL